MSRRANCFGTAVLALWITCLFWCSLVQGRATTKENGDPIDYLDEDSVVLITGAAGFIGSELALALHRTYAVKRILCVDKMGGDHPSTQEALALFEFQRFVSRSLVVIGFRAPFRKNLKCLIVSLTTDTDLASPPNHACTVHFNAIQTRAESRKSYCASSSYLPHSFTFPLKKSRKFGRNTEII